MQKILLRYYFLVDVLLSNFRLLRRPFRLFVVVTKKCQSRCQHCKIWQETPQEELTLSDYQRIAARSPWLKWLHLTGGEPTDRDDFAEIISTFHRHCKKLFFVNFTTNGLEPERIENAVRQVATLRIPKVIVGVSIDGPPTVNDSLRGIEGDFEKATETLRRLRRIQGVETQVSMTLYKKNRHLIDEAFAEIKRRVPDFRLSDMNLNIPHTSSHFFGNQMMRMSTDADLLNRVRKYRRASGFDRTVMSLFKRAYFRHLRRYLMTGRSPVTCAALRSSVYISERGNLFPCTIWSRELGHLQDFDYDVVKALRSQEASQARSLIAQKQCPNCWTPCEAYSSMLGNLPQLFL